MFRVGMSTALEDYVMHISSEGSVDSGSEDESQAASKMLLSICNFWQLWCLEYEVFPVSRYRSIAVIKTVSLLYMT